MGRISGSSARPDAPNLRSRSSSIPAKRHSRAFSLAQSSAPVMNGMFFSFAKSSISCHAIIANGFGRLIMPKHALGKVAFLLALHLHVDQHPFEIH